MTHQTFNQARSTIIGVGGFGLFAVAHLAPRLQFANAQRRMANPALPDLNKLVSYALLIPRRPNPSALTEEERPGRIELWIPRTQNIQEMAPYEEEFRRAARKFVEGLRMGGVPQMPDRPSSAWQCLGAAYTKWRDDHGILGNKSVFVAEVVNDALINFMESKDIFRTAATCILERSSGSPEVRGERVSRRDIVSSLKSASNSFGSQLDYQLGEAYHDLTQPIEYLTQSTTYIIASATEDVAGALLWPLGHMLRRRLSDYPMETVALISTGPYSPPPYRAYEEAAAYATLSEIDYLSRKSVNEDGSDGGPDIRNTPYSGWQLLEKKIGEPAYDRCYLLDAVKASRATAAGQEEVAISIANALELFMMGNGDHMIQQQLAAGLSLDQRTTYSALGAAVKFLPIQKIQYWVRSRLAARIVKERMLGIREPQAEQKRGDEYAREHGLTLESVGRAIIAEVPYTPVVMRASGRDKGPPTFGIRDTSVLLPPELQRIPGQQPPPRRSPVEWYRLISRHREELLRNEQIRPLIQQPLATPTGGTTASRQLGIWRLYMHLAGGTTQTIQLDSTMTPLTTGLYTASHNQQEVVLTASTDRTAAGEQITAARAIRYTVSPFSYLGLPITETRQAMDDSYRLSMEPEESDEHDGTLLGRFENDLIRRTTALITGDNKGLHIAQAWLGGVLKRIREELKRLPPDDREEQIFQEDWNRRLIALEQTLGGRPRPDGQSTRGLAQRRPESAALIGRATLAAGFLLFAGFTFLRYVQPLPLEVWQTLGLALALVIAPFLLAGLFRLAYELQVARFRRRTLALYREQIDRQVTLSTLNAIEAILRRASILVLTLRLGIGRDIETAEAWCDERGAEDVFRIEDHHDTILRQAIGDPDLVSAVSHMNTREQDEMLDRIGNLWQWRGQPAKDKVIEALKAYVAYTPPPAMAGPASSGHETMAGAAGQAADPAQPADGEAAHRANGHGAAAATQAAATPPTIIWNWLQATTSDVADRFVKQQNRYTQNIEDYIARHPRSVMGPGAENGDPLSADDLETTHNFLIDMGFLAKPYIFLEEVELTQPVVSIDLLGMSRADETRFDRNFLADLRSDPRWSTHPPTSISTHDPFSITYLRTLHGLPARSMSRWERYHDTFAALSRTDRGLIDILKPASAYDVAKEAKGADRNEELFGGIDDEEPLADAVNSEGLSS